MPEKRRPLSEDEIPLTESGERMPYDIVRDENGDVEVGPSIWELDDQDEPKDTGPVATAPSSSDI